MATNAISSNAVVKTSKTASPHNKSALSQLPARLIGAIFAFTDVSDTLSGKRVSREFKTGFDFWVKTVQTLDLQNTSVLNLARLFGESAQNFPRVTTMKINLHFGAFLVQRMDEKSNLDAMIGRIPQKCPNISDLSIGDDAHQYGEGLVAELASSLRCVKVTVAKDQTIQTKKLVKLCPPKLTQFKVAGIYGYSSFDRDVNASLYPVISFRKLTALEAENLTDACLLTIGQKCDVKQLHLTELQLSWKSSPTPSSVGFNFLKSCKKLKHLGLQFFSARLHQSVTAKTMVGLVEDLPDLETFSLKADEGMFDNVSIGIALIKNCPNLKVKLNTRASA